MAQTFMPFVCERCGHPWDGDNVLRIEDGSFLRNVALDVSGVRMPCPRCRHVNSPVLPKGVYNAGGGHWELVRLLVEDMASAQASVDDFNKLLRLLRKADAESQDSSQIAETIAAETPFHRFSETLSKHPNITSNVIAVIVAVGTSFVIAAFGIGSSPAPTAPVNLTQQQVNAIAEKVAHQLEADEQYKAPSSVWNSPHREGSARNKPCHCGSGLKYKKCCGDSAKRGAGGNRNN